MIESYFTVEATGRTYPIKDQLQSWAFFWDPNKRAWINECASTGELQYFMAKVSDGDWPGVILSCEKHPDYSYIN